MTTQDRIKRQMYKCNSCGQTIGSNGDRIVRRQMKTPAKRKTCRWKKHPVDSWWIVGCHKKYRYNPHYFNKTFGELCPDCGRKVEVEK